MNLKKIIVSAGIAFGAFLLFSFAWKGIHSDYASFFRKLTSRFFIAPSSALEFEFKPAPNGSESDMYIYFYSKKEMLAAEQRSIVTKKTVTIQKYYVEMDSWYISYLPFTLMLSLIIATPVPAKRKFRSVLWGILFTGLFVLFKVYISTLFYIANFNPPGAGYGEFGSQVINALHLAFVGNMGANATIPMLMWILVTFRREDIKIVFPEAVAAKIS